MRFAVRQPLELRCAPRECPQLVIHCDEERTQSRNSKLAFERLQDMLDRAAIVPKERIISETPPERVKAERRREKRHQAQKKQARKGNFDY